VEATLLILRACRAMLAGHALGINTCAGRTPRSGDANQAELLERRDAVVQPHFLDDPAVLHLQYGRARELHLPSRVRRQPADQEVAEGRAAVGAGALPA